MFQQIATLGSSGISAKSDTLYQTSRIENSKQREQRLGHNNSVRYFIEIIYKYKGTLFHELIDIIVRNDNYLDEKNYGPSV